MKIRHKHTGEVVEGVYYDTDKRRYTGVREDRISHFPIMYWEPVQDEAWEDCTSECEASGGIILHHFKRGGLIGSTCVVGDQIGIADDYRLRKVVLLKHDRNVSFPCHAFVVERKRPA